jgi:type VI secretion system protein ImpA
VGSNPVIDLGQLLAPVSEENPCGESLRWDPLYDEIKEARREDDKDALGGDGRGQANWTLVCNKASAALAQRSKDLMLAGYLLEALVQLHGFAGLRDGLRVINGLLEGFWDGMFPAIDGEDLEPRAAPVVWFTEGDRGARLPNRVREIAIVPGANGAPGFSWLFWKSRYVPPKGDNEEEGAYTHRRAEADERAKAFENAAAAVPLAHIGSAREDIQECQAELAHLDRVLDERFGRSAPGTSALKQALEECLALATRIFKDRGGQVGDAQAADDTAVSTEQAPGASPQEGAGMTGPVRSRDEAVRRLAEVAVYFRQAEPHSPVSYLVERASSWARMSFEELLAELVKDSGTRDQIGELLGIKRTEES